MTRTILYISTITFGGRFPSVKTLEEIKLETRLESLLQDKDKFPGDAYTCDETIVEISHLEGLSDLFRRGRKIILNMKFMYKEVSGVSSIVKGKVKGKTGLWSRLYEHLRYRAKHCKHRLHCLINKETEEDVDINIEIPPHIVNYIMDNSRKRKAEVAPNNCRRYKTCASKIISDEDLSDVDGDR
ncbi:hypothetical protein BJ875DRAFT_507897 [Amylocarpus encephaloides]|uniref:Uncharacterized protein n=1 Tax=Amylocarpus encephaloides TaxID=45428 RepID=A0A9P7Y996_9HELO|nr:hypothetical protein BJ875DRAFT_507897 [Amylocarpus encephaloides]